MGNIAVADDDRDIREQLTRLLNRNGHQVRHAANGPEVLELLDAVELVIMDLHMPRMDGMQSFREIRDRAPHLPVILMTGSGTSRTAIEATKAGAFDYIRKPFAADYLLNSIRRALDMNALVPAQQHFVDESVFNLQPGAMIGNSRPMQELYKTIGRVAPTSATVLIRGETGTGKELVAQSLHDHSERRGKPLVMVNCAAIPETLLESELFGHEKGAFTGARQRHIGKFELANGGSILLDEIGDMPLRTQAKILRVLQDKRIERVGGEEPVEVDVRIFAATHRHLEQAILEGGFVQQQARHHGRIARTAIGHDQDQHERLDGEDHAEDQQQLDLPHDQVQIHQPEAAEAGGAIYGGRIQHFARDVLQTGQVDQKVDARDPGEADQRQAHQHGAVAAQPIVG